MADCNVIHPLSLNAFGLLRWLSGRSSSGLDSLYNMFTWKVQAKTDNLSKPPEGVEKFPPHEGMDANLTSCCLPLFGPSRCAKSSCREQVPPLMPRTERVGNVTPVGGDFTKWK